MASQSSPKYVYKIVPSCPPEPFPEEYPLSDLDRNDGFIHLSTATQVPLTADLFFNNLPSLWVIKLRFIEFESSSKWEDGFPHLYGNFGKDYLESVQQFDKTGDQPWSEIMKGAAWLE
ncbi:Fc.00g102620.m01.CDS01 [Cosmosporella sp. VM-42]